MMNNAELSLARKLKADDTLEYSDGFVIQADIVAHYRMNGIVPANGERRVYCKSPTLKKVFKIRLNKVQTSAGFTVSGSGEMEIDWGDNSPLEALRLPDTQQTLSHRFDNIVPCHRNITVYGDFSLKQLDFTDLQALAVSLFSPLAVEKFTIKNARLDIGFMALLKEVYEVSLSGLKTTSLLPLLENKNLMRLDLSDINVLPETLDEYLIALVEQYYGRRSCTIILTEYPSGEYIEPGRGENGKLSLPAAWKPSGYSATNPHGTKPASGNSLSTEHATLPKSRLLIPNF